MYVCMCVWPRYWNRTNGNLSVIETESDSVNFDDPLCRDLMLPQFPLSKVRNWTGRLKKPSFYFSESHCSSQDNDMFFVQDPLHGLLPLQRTCHYLVNFSAIPRNRNWGFSVGRSSFYYHTPNLATHPDRGLGTQLVDTQALVKKRNEWRRSSAPLSLYTVVQILIRRWE